MDALSYKKQYRTVGFTIFVISALLLLLRIAGYGLSIALIDKVDADAMELITDVAFTLPCQILVLFVFPFLMYKFYLKKSASELMAFSGYRKIDWKICLLSFALGIFVLGLSWYFSIIWQAFLMLLGYDPSGSSYMPPKFDILYFLTTVILTSVLPAICEEFTNRGGFITTMRGSYDELKTVIIIAVAFGLFHQNATQLLYTALMGGLLAFLVLRTGSVFPAVIVHFTNNFLSLCLDNVDAYISTAFTDYITSSFTVLSAFATLCFAFAFVIVFAIVKLTKRNKDNYYVRYNASVTASGFKPTLRDNAFYFGAVVMTVASTIVTFGFGL